MAKPITRDSDRHTLLIVVAKSKTNCILYMKWFDDFESNLESIIGDARKMSLFSNYIKELPDEIGRPLYSLCISDTLLFAVEYHDLSEQQQRIVNAMLKILSVTDDQYEFVTRMNAAIPNLLLKNK